jgi:hypothetical protein
MVSMISWRELSKPISSRLLISSKSKFEFAELEYLRLRSDPSIMEFERKPGLLKISDKRNERIRNEEYTIFLKEDNTLQFSNII